MRLRYTINKILPAKDCVRLTDEEARAILWDIYFNSIGIKRIEVKDNEDPETQEEFPFRIGIGRDKRHGDGKVPLYVESRAYTKEAIEQIGIEALSNDPEKIARINRVEQVARRIKRTALILGLLTIPSFLQSQFGGGIPSCEGVDRGTKSLDPAGPSDISHAEESGKIICNIGNTTYKLGLG